jgi:hypothetical protein
MPNDQLEQGPPLDPEAILTVVLTAAILAFLFYLLA